ncbi:MAG: hypothetical protein Q4A37_02790 [Candidatus Saccharibacteria bacterium]|nr:hypothetical protein [Candidatus Saccharibacteria bacterium]
MGAECKLARMVAGQRVSGVVVNEAGATAVYVLSVWWQKESSGWVKDEVSKCDEVDSCNKKIKSIIVILTTLL